MNSRLLALFVAFFLAFAPGAGAQGPGVTPGKPLSQAELDQMLAPVALYPDALLAQIFMASTYPLEVVSAARWVQQNPKTTGKALEDAMQKQPWDPSVKSLAPFPTVLAMMNDKLEWTQQLGDAFLGQRADVIQLNRTTLTRANWQHDANHRKGVPYRDPSIAKRYERNQAADEVRKDIRQEQREDHRGPSPQSADRPGPPSGPRQRDRDRDGDGPDFGGRRGDRK